MITKSTDVMILCYEDERTLLSAVLLNYKDFQLQGFYYLKVQALCQKPKQPNQSYHYAYALPTRQ